MRIAVIFILVLFLISCTPDSSSKQLEDIQIMEYEGKQLSSVYDFRENSIKGVQYIDLENYSLRVHGLADKEIIYTYDDLKALDSYKKVVTLNCVEGWSATILWQGFLVRDILGNVSSDVTTVIFHAYDGYSTSFPIEYFYDNDIIMAYDMNGQSMIPERGFPLLLVAESKWGYKWIKWVTSIELSNDEKYKGYWESRGYSNSGDLDKGFLG